MARASAWSGGIDQQTLAIRICSNMLIWGESSLPKRFHYSGMRANISEATELGRRERRYCRLDARPAMTSLVIATTPNMPSSTVTMWIAA
jgi:hypothetical protein